MVFMLPHLFKLSLQHKFTIQVRAVRDGLNTGSVSLVFRCFRCPLFGSPLNVHLKTPTDKH